MLRRTGIQAGYGAKFLTQMKYSDETLEQDARKKGNYTPIKWEGKETDIGFYTLGHSGGYLILYENKTENITFNGTFSFTLKNLKIEGERGSVFKLELKPGETKVKHLKIMN